MYRGRRAFTAITKKPTAANQPYVPDIGTFPTFHPKPNASNSPNLSKYNNKWSQEAVFAAMKDHSIFSWGASDPLLASSILADRAEGIYIYDKSGKRFTDWGSGAVCTNLGHTVPPQIVREIQSQLHSCAFVYGDLAYTEARAKLSNLLGEIVAGDINAFYFASSGAEANEAAVRMARRFTGRPKVLSRYRSYHGGTSGTLTMTGDARRWFVDPAPGFVKIPEPFPLSHRWDDADETVGVQRCLAALHDQILMEGANSIAAIVLEPVTGAGGWLKAPTAYMQGVRALCDKYGILLISDEVMTGFGRTGRMFGFEHFDGVLPDLITFAKGVTAAYLPLSGVGVRDHIFNHFKTTPLGYGSTYFSHPVCCAAGLETVKYLLENNIVDNVVKMEKVMVEELSKLVQRHPSVRQARVVGLGGGFDLAGPDGNALMGIHETHEQVALLKKRLLDRGVITLVRGHHIHCTPPLVINEQQIRETFALISDALIDLDHFVTKRK